MNLKYPVSTDQRIQSRIHANTNIWKNDSLFFYDTPINGEPEFICLPPEIITLVRPEALPFDEATQLIILCLSSWLINVVCRQSKKERMKYGSYFSLYQR